MPTTRIRYEIHVESDVAEAPAGSRTLKKVPTRAAAAAALHRLIAYSRGSGTATYHLTFECTPTPNLTYAGFTANGATEPAGARWTGELEVRPRLKRRDSIPKLNAISATTAVHTTTPASIECEVTLAARSTVLQSREAMSATDPRHRGTSTLTVHLTP